MLTRSKGDDEEQFLTRESSLAGSSRGMTRQQETELDLTAVDDTGKNVLMIAAGLGE